MPKERIKLEDVVETTKKLFHEYFSGNPELWFSYLCNESIWIGHSEPLLFGGDMIRNHFQKLKGIQSSVLKEEYHPMRLSDDSALVCGQFVLKTPDRSYRTITYFSMVYRQINGKLKIIHQHHSHEYVRISTDSGSGALNMDLNTTQFVKNLLLERKTTKHILVKSGKQTLYVNPASVLYVQSQGKRTELFCADRLISCNSSIGELAKQLPKEFYPVHRGYLVNILYITALRRFEVELVSGITIPVPAPAYKKVKEDLNRMRTESLEASSEL